ncbi:unnamed protein product, partial [Dicrocoelium dendriticum]
TENSSGPRTEPCGTPLSTACRNERLLPTRIHCSRPARKLTPTGERDQLFHTTSTSVSREWGTVSKALAKSMNTTSTACLRLRPSTHELPASSSDTKILCENHVARR